jgi:hypothetical protein
MKPLNTRNTRKKSIEDENEGPGRLRSFCAKKIVTREGVTDSGE